MKAGCFEKDDFRSGQVTTCFHSGDLGDIIYSLLFCKSLGDIVLFLGPDPKAAPRQQINHQTFEWLAPLLRVQPWIKEVRYTETVPECDFNLNEFRNTWLSPHTGLAKHRNLFETYPEHFHRPPVLENESWLDADPDIDHTHPVVISRSMRYQNPRFPWAIVAKMYGGRIRFVGLEEEYNAWTKQFGKVSVYYRAANALTLAKIIKGSTLFIGNQSFPMAVALALNMPLIQESWPQGADCIFKRANAQFTNVTCNIKWPVIDAVVEREMQPRPGPRGVYEIGPMAGGAGLGDTLMVLPLARALGSKAVMVLPRSMTRFAFLFRGVCPVRICNNHPVFHYKSGILQSAWQLQKYNLSGHSPIPVVDLDPTKLETARTELSRHANPIAFCPTCSPSWEHARQRPALFWRPVITELKKRYTVLQFGRPDYPTLDGAVRMPYVSLEELAAMYAVIGNYVGVDTGDYHLMIAVGGRAVVAQQDPWTEHEAWSYKLPTRVAYGKLSHPYSVLDAIKKLEL